MFNGFKKFVNEWQFLFYAVVGIGGILYYAQAESVRMAQYNKQRQEVVCPSFLSISRSSRDTLIVMRNEPLCNSYILDNLQ